MKIRKLELKNIGVFEDVTIEFPEKKNDGAEIHILTGQNGTGKTTILQALASGVYDIEPFKSIPKYPKQVLQDFYKRFFNQQSKATIKIGELSITIKKNEEEDKNPISFALRAMTEMSYKSNKSYSFAAFSYSNDRKIKHEDNLNIQNASFDPILEALEFLKSDRYQTSPLNQWLANTISKRGFAKDEGDEEKVRRFDKYINIIESLVEEITEKTIKFEPIYETGIKIVANIEGKKLDFDVLPDGLRSLISWIGDLLMRMDALKWKDDLPIFDREFILFLDEIEVHLHPYWQRKILPVVQKTFKNAQIFITTHSPFIVNSVDGAWIYELKLDKNGNSYAEKPQISSTSMPIDEVLTEIYDIEPTQMYGVSVEGEIETFQSLVKQAYQKDSHFDKQTLLEEAKKLALKSVDLRNNVQFELRQLSKILDDDFSI